MSTCVRRAWLTLPSGQSIDLHNEAAGYFVTSLDLGSPDVREVTTARPDRDGLDDRTLLLGGRVVSVDLTALAGAGATLDAVATAFGPYMNPAARPTLHYVLDRPGVGERTLVLRAKAYTWAADDAYQRDVQLQWLAADPIARDPNVKSSTAWAGAGAGRTYPLTFPRTYPAGGTSSTSGTISAAGDVDVRPLVRVYGPATAPAVVFTYGDGSTSTLAFDAGYDLAAGDWLDIDAEARTVNLNSDPTRPELAAVDWPTSAWPFVPAGTAATFVLDASSTSGVTQAVAYWQDGYLA